ncbi:MAG: nuclear transport factor 2 family protein [Terracidiphilus sp.]
MTIGKTFVAAFVAGVCLCTTRLVMQAQETTTAQDSVATAEIRHQVENYMQSIDAADTSPGATVWSPTPDATFIEPQGHERGWDQIASVVYDKLMGQTFSRRTLKNVSDVSIHLYGEAAVVEFDWDFVATLRSDGKTLVHTTGRESQVYVNLPGKGWRLVHVHYSGPPVKGPGGFSTGGSGLKRI